MKNLFNITILSLVLASCSGKEITLNTALNSVLSEESSLDKEIYLKRYEYNFKLSDLISEVSLLNKCETTLYVNKKLSEDLVSFKSFKKDKIKDFEKSFIVKNDAFYIKRSINKIEYYNNLESLVESMNDFYDKVHENLTQCYYRTSFLEEQKRVSSKAEKPIENVVYSPKKTYKTTTINEEL